MLPVGVRKFQRAEPAFLPCVTEHVNVWAKCELCPLGRPNTFWTNHVFMRGFIPCDVLFVCEAPDFSEDVVGMPMLNDRGLLLDQIIDQSSKQAYGREDGYKWCITNAICCLPSDGRGGTRPAKQKEMDACKPRLIEFCNIAQPNLIVAVGNAGEKAVAAVIKSGQLSFKPTIEQIRHPTWIHNQTDKQLEIKRAVMCLAEALEKL